VLGCQDDPRAGSGADETADRGYGEAQVDKQLTDLGVTNVVIPRKGKPSLARRAGRASKTLPPHHQMANRQRRPDHLKRNYGWDRARIDGTEGAATGHGVLAHNLVKISALAA
jgi:IS5 family transposase